MEAALAVLGLKLIIRRSTDLIAGFVVRQRSETDERQVQVRLGERNATLIGEWLLCADCVEKVGVAASLKS